MSTRLERAVVRVLATLSMTVGGIIVGYAIGSPGNQDAIFGIVGLVVLSVGLMAFVVNF